MNTLSGEYVSQLCTHYLFIYLFGPVSHWRFCIVVINLWLSSFLQFFLYNLDQEHTMSKYIKTNTEKKRDKCFPAKQKQWIQFSSCAEQKRIMWW